MGIGTKHSVYEISSQRAAIRQYPQPLRRCQSHSKYDAGYQCRLQGLQFRYVYCRNGVESVRPQRWLLSQLPRQAQAIQHRRMRIARRHCVANAKQLKAARRIAGHGLGLAINQRAIVHRALVA